MTPGARDTSASNLVDEFSQRKVEPLDDPLRATIARIDCFLFFDELDMLELRMNVLWDCIDYFVIVQSNRTFRGEVKEFVDFDKEPRFDNYRSKMVTLRVKGEEYNGMWGEDYVDSLRDSTKEVLVQLGIKDGDIVLLGDVDEIPDLGKFYSTYKLELPVSLQMKHYNYYWNCRVYDNGWTSPKMFRWGQFKDYRLSDVRRRMDLRIAPDMGWHFSFMGGAEKIRQKIRTGGDPLNIRDCDRLSDLDYIKRCMEGPRDFYGRGFKLAFVEFDSTFPKYMLDNIDRFKDQIKEVKVSEHKGVKGLKLEIGCGSSPESIDEEWVHNDLNPFPHVEYVCRAVDLPLPSKSCDYIYMRGVIEHMTCVDAEATLVKIHNLLTDDGYADIKEIPNALSYVEAYLKFDDHDESPTRSPKPKFVCPLPNTITARMPPLYDRFLPATRWLIWGLFGGQRWPGDDHKSLWTREIVDVLFSPLFDYEVVELRPFDDIDVIHYNVRVRRKKVVAEEMVFVCPKYSDACRSLNCPHKGEHQKKNDCAFTHCRFESNGSCYSSCVPYRKEAK